MSVGLGIFLGLVFCGLVYLFTKNRDRLNLKKLWKISVGVIGGIVLLVIFLNGADYLYKKYESRLRVVTEFSGITIGQSFQDVVFKTGATKDEGWKNPNPEIYPLETDGVYHLKAKGFMVTFSRGKVLDIDYQCNDQVSDSTSLNGIRCGDMGDVVNSRFGVDLVEYCPAKGEKFLDPYEFKFRVYVANKFGVEYALYENRVVGMSHFERGTFKMPSGYVFCSEKKLTANK